MVAMDYGLWPLDYVTDSALIRLILAYLRSAASSFQNIVMQENPRGFQPTSPRPFTVVGYELV